MKKFLILLLAVLLTLGTAPSNPSSAVPIAEIIKQAIVKVIKAVDLQIQRLQNKTIWLQNAQKVLENKLSQLRLKEISEWTGKQRQLYEQYYQELWKVKNTLATFHKVKEIAQKQAALVKEYQRAFALFRQDPHFTPGEIGYMLRVYTGMVEASVQNLDGLLLVVNAFTTQMSDAKRLAIINAVDLRLDQTLFDLRRFNRQNVLLSLQRAKDQSEIQTMRRLYGLPE